MFFLNQKIHNFGFSLVELSIVLVILGLLTGGILTGKNLIKAAELRSVPTEFQQWQTAVHSFKQKYFALPGDLNNATQFWGSANGASCNVPSTGSGTGTQTCNGDGNGYITSTFSTTGGRYQEMFTFWQHLSNAGMINGVYSGKAGASGHEDYAIINENVPASKFPNAGWSIVNELLPNHPAHYIPTTYGTSSTGWPMIFGAQDNNYELFTSALTPAEAWNIDSKVDDGKPMLSKVVTVGSCIDYATTPESYNLDNNNLVCILLFRH